MNKIPIFLPQGIEFNNTIMTNNSSKNDKIVDEKTDCKYAFFVQEFLLNDGKNILYNIRSTELLKLIRECC